MKLYAGIGARKTPVETLRLMQRIGQRLSELGYTLRTGGASGADSAFAEGALELGGPVELLLPWPRFNGWTERPGLRIHDEVSPGALEEARAFHPAWEQLKPSVRKLHGRNAQIILGPDLEAPVRFVILWTPGGRKVGGTGVAWRIAERHNIPVVNLARGRKTLEEIQALL